MGEYLPQKHEALSSNSSTARKEKKSTGGLAWIPSLRPSLPCCVPYLVISFVKQVW
jgi:hypothetical protein